MPDRSRLERSYHRLLWAYPRFYRRHRGLEIVTTMLEAAKPGQVRPTRAEVVHLLASGLRHRLTPPGWIGKVATGIVTLWVALVLGGTGAYAAWTAQYGDLPRLDDPRIEQIADSLAGRTADRIHIDSSEPLEIAFSHDSWGELQTFAAEGWAGAKPVPAGHARVYDEAGSRQAVLAEAKKLLSGEGWDTGAITDPGMCECDVLWAGRDGLLLRLQSAPSSLLIVAYQAEPQGVLEAAVAGFAAGLLLAWPMLTWLAHRCRRVTGLESRIAIVVIGTAVLCAGLANTVDSALGMVPDPDTQSVLLAADLMYPLANQFDNPLAAIVIGLGLALLTLVFNMHSSSPRWSHGRAKARG